MRRKAVADPPEVSAGAAGLKYVSGRLPGFRRLELNGRFVYKNTAGRAIRDVESLARIKNLAIPPAWTDVWISPDSNGHLQASGRDARGRKQYCYHVRWRRIRDETKYQRLADFGRALPRIRARIARDLALPGLPRDKVLATIVRLLETTSIRVGNEEYAKANHSFGLTTMRNRHVDIEGAKVRFYFRGKSGRRHEIDIKDPYLARIVRRLRDLPGYELFQYVDEGGGVRSIGSGDVNEYVRETSGEDFTAKDFRTWNATVLAAVALGQAEPAKTIRQTRKTITQAIESVAARLGNTVTVCRNCYVHPAVMDAYTARTLAAELKPGPAARRLSAEESAVLRFLIKLSKRRRQSLEQALRKSVRARAA